MRPLTFHRHAANYLKRMPPERKAQVIAALEALKGTKIQLNIRT
jgi:hypothetical protein